MSIDLGPKCRDCDNLGFLTLPGEFMVCSVCFTNRTADIQTSNAEIVAHATVDAPASSEVVPQPLGGAGAINSNTSEASGTARKAPSDRSLGRSSRNDSSRLASNSGDVLGIHEPRSMTRGGDTVASAPSGRADESAKCPDVTGCLSVVANEDRGAPALVGVSSLDLAAPTSSALGAALSSDSELVAAWLLQPRASELPAMRKYASTFAVATASESTSKSTSLVKA